MANSLFDGTLPNGKAYLELDMGDVREKTQELAGILDTDTFQKAMRTTIYETSKHVKTIVKKRIREEYRVGEKPILQSLGSPQITVGATEISCLIPVRRNRGIISTGSMSSGCYMALKRGPSAKVLVAGNSMLPHSKGKRRIHFYVPSGTLKGHVMVRHEDGKHWKGKRRDENGNVTGKISRVGSISHGVGIAVPQMPMNRSAEAIQNDAAEYMLKRLDHYIGVALGGAAK